MTRRTLIPPAELRRLADRLVSLQGRLDLVERSMRTTQLGHSSLENSSITIRDADGLPRGLVGLHPDGVPGVRTVNTPPPSRPNAPELTSLIAGAGVSWNGELFDGPPKPGTFSHLAVYLSPAGPDFIHGPSNLVGTLTRAGTLTVAPLPPGEYWARFVAYNADTPQEASEPSFTAGPVAPRQVVGDDLIDGIVTTVKLAQDAVTEAKLAAGAVTETKVADDAISTPKLVAGSVQTEKIAAGAVQAEQIAAAAVTAEKIEALAVTADKIAANAVQAGHIEAGAVDAEKLAANLVIAGTPGGDRVEISEANGIEQWLDGQRTLLIPPDGLSEFVGGLSTGTTDQFIRLDPRDEQTSWPRLILVDDNSTRSIVAQYVGNEFFLERQTRAELGGDVRGGRLLFHSGGSWLAHFRDSDGVELSRLNLNNSGVVALEALTSDVLVTAQNALRLESTAGSVQAIADQEVQLNSGTNVRITSANDVYIDAAGGDAALRLFSDGEAQLISNGSVKSFVVPHPLDDDRWLVHGCTESPVAGVEYWGEATIEGGSVEVPLPSYFEALTRPRRHVLVSPVVLDERDGPPSLPRVGATTPRDGKFTIYSDGPDGSRVSWLVKAERHVDFEVEPLRSDVEVAGDGPYLTATPRTGSKQGVW